MQEKESDENHTFFTQRLRYYIQGAKQCFSILEGFDPGLNKLLDQGLVDLVRELEEKISSFCMLERSSQGAETKGIESSGDLKSRSSISEGLLKQQREELSRVEKRNRGLRKSNRRLKKMNRSLTKNFRRLGSAFFRLLKLRGDRHKAQGEEQQKTTKEKAAKLEGPSKNPNLSTEIRLLSKPQVREIGEKGGNEGSTENKQIVKKSRKLLNKSTQSNPQKPLKNSTPDSEDLNKAKIDALYQGYLNSSENQISKMEIKIEILMDLKETGVIGENYSVLALKNNYSFMVGTFKKGLRLVENGATIYSSAAQHHLGDIVYVRDLNSYFLSYDQKLYRKDIDECPPTLFMDVYCGLRFGGCFQYSKLNKRLIVNKDKKAISVINLRTKELEIEVEKPFGEDIFCFRLFGDQEDRVMGATTHGHVCLYQLDYLKKRGSLALGVSYQLDQEAEEKIKSVTICSKNRYIFIEIGSGSNRSICSRIAIARLHEAGITKINCFEQQTYQMGDKLALECYGYVGSHVLWVGLSKQKRGRSQVFDYDVSTGELRELSHLAMDLDESNPVKFERLGNYFYFVGSKGKLLRLYLEI